MYEVTSLALECLRIVLEVLSGKQIRFGSYDLYVRGERDVAHAGESWKERVQVFDGVIYTVDTDGQGLAFGRVLAEIQLSNYGRNWHVSTIGFHCHGLDGAVRRYRAVCVHRTQQQPIDLTQPLPIPVRYPLFVVVTNEEGLTFYQVGRAFNNVRQFSASDWARSKDTFRI